MQLPRLSDLPLSVRVAVTAYLVVTGFGYTYALANVKLKVGMKPPEVLAHYRGGTVRVEQPKLPAPALATAAKSGEEEVNLDNDAIAAPEAPKVITKPAPSIEALVQEGHTHIFGQTSLFFGVVACALLLSMKEKPKALLVAVPFLAIAMDHIGFLTTRFVGPQFVYLVIVSGGLMAASHALITGLVLWQMWIQKKPATAAAALREIAHA